MLEREPMQVQVLEPMRVRGTLHEARAVSCAFLHKLSSARTHSPKPTDSRKHKHQHTYKHQVGWNWD